MGAFLLAVSTNVRETWGILLEVVELKPAGDSSNWQRVGL